MADGTHIEWTDATVNAINGCTVLSPGCTNCYAMRLAGTRLRNHSSRAGLTIDSKAGPVWNGEVRLHEPALELPRRWPKSRMIFWNAHGDMFHPAVPDEWIDRCFDVMEATRHHIHQVLTKRPERMAAYVQARWALPSNINAFYDLPEMTELFEHHPNIWLGVSVEDQVRAEQRVPVLLAIPAAVKWLSCEPLLEEIDLTRIFMGEADVDQSKPHADGLKKIRFNINALAGVESFGWRGLSWVVAGGESGSHARPMSLAAARGLRDQCAAAGVPFLFKQWGQWLPSGQMTADGKVWVTGSGHALHAVKSMTGRYLDGVHHDAMPQVAA